MRVVLFLAPLLLAPALALPARVPAPARLYAQPSPSGRVLTTLAPRTEIEVKACAGGWCSVLAGGRSGYVPRPQVAAFGNCAALRAVGLGDLRRGEASYNGRRDRDGDGLGCDTAAP